MGSCKVCRQTTKLYIIIIIISIVLMAAGAFMGSKGTDTNSAGAGAGLGLLGLGAFTLSGLFGFIMFISCIIFAFSKTPVCEDVNGVSKK